MYIQTLVIFGVSGLLLIFGQCNAAFSLLWGGLICIVPNAYFAYKLFAKTGAKAVREIITSFYLGELVKFIITILLFAIAFKLLSVNKLAIFIGYIIAQFTFWLIALIKDPTVNKL